MALTPRERARQDAFRARAQIVDAVALEISADVMQAMAGGFGAVNRQLGAFFERVSRDLVASPQLARVHQEVGERAQRAILNSYAQRVTAREGPASRFNAAYRNRRSRFGGGALRSALAHPGHVEAGQTYLRLLDIDILDTEAAHWYRLNFGAGPRGRETRSAVFQMILDGRPIGPIGFTTGPSRSPVILPAGFFLNMEGSRQGRDASRRGEDAFFPAGGAAGVGARGRPLRARVTAGIAGRNYLDAGLRTLARDLPRAYDETFRQILAAAPGSTRESVDIRVPALRTRMRTVVRPITEPRRFSRGVRIPGR